MKASSTIKTKLNSKGRGLIVEKKLGIPPDYQYKALFSKNFIKANWHRNKLFILDKLLNLDKGMLVLDLGTGSGNFEINFSKRVKKIIGVDYNDEALLFLDKYLLRRGIKNVELIQADIRELSKIKTIPKVDLIIMSEVIEHLRINEAKKLIKTLKNLLKEKGKIFITTPNYKSAWLLIEFFLDITGLTPAINGVQHFTRFDKKKIKSIFETAGFICERTYTFNLFSFIIPLSKVSRMVCNLELSIPFPVGNLIAASFARPTNPEHKKSAR